MQADRRSRAFRALISLAVAAQTACGARSDAGDLGRLGALDPPDGGAALVTAGQTPPRVRDNPSARDPDRPGASLAQRDPFLDPEPGFGEPDPSIEPGDPASPLEPDVPTVDPARPAMPIEPPDPPPGDPASSDPASSDPASSDPASSDPASSDPVSNDPVPSDRGPPDPDTPRLWLYVDDSSGMLVNVYNDLERHMLPAVDPNGELLEPWSHDGRRLVQMRDSAVAFTDLVTGQELGRDEAGRQATLHGWVDGYGALVSYYYEGSPLLYSINVAGNFLVHATGDVALATKASSSPTGNGFLYTTEVDGQGRVYWVPFDGVGIPVDLLEAGLGALNEVAWSPDGQWAAFGAGGSGLAYVFHTSEPLNLAQIGDTSPYLEFSPTSDVLLNLRGSELDLIQLTGPGQVSLTTITSGSPAHFSDDGAYVYYVDAGGTGILRGWDGSALTSIHEVDGFSHVCPLTWTGPSRFVYQRCATEERGLAEGVIDGGELTTVTHAGSLLANLVIGPAQRCFVNWESDRLDVGTTQLPLVTEFTRVAPGAITHAALASRDNAVVWVEEGTDVYWLPLSSSCTVSTLPELVASGATVQSLRFVSEWP